MTICDAIRMVVESRQRYRSLKTQVQTLKQEFTARHVDLFKEEALGKEAVTEAETALRALAVDIFRRTAQKTVHPGVKIREVTQLAYDPKCALEWAMEHRMALALDAKAFEKIAKAASLPFVQITVEPQVTLATRFENEQAETPAPQENGHGKA